LGRAFLNNVPLHRRGERERLVWERFRQELDPQGAKVHVCMGDLFDQPVVPLKVIRDAAITYQEAARANSTTEYVVLRGNHDASRDLEAVSAFDIFKGLVGATTNISIVDSVDMKTVDGTTLAFFGWSPLIPAADLIKQVLVKDGIAFGHWDVDLRSDPFNQIPTKELAAQGFVKAYTGHVHLPQTFTRNGVEVAVTGSMLPYAHDQDPTGETYVTLTLDDVRAAGAGALKDKCVRIKLKQGEVFDAQIDCLHLQVEHEAIEQQTIDVSIEEFDLQKLFSDVLVDHQVPTDIQTKVRDEWTRRFMSRQ
jgi:DNA repair exonuclease SbcCD nuclease subunit